MRLCTHKVVERVTLVQVYRDTQTPSFACTDGYSFFIRTDLTFVSIKGRYYLRYVHVTGRIVLKWILRKQDQLVGCCKHDGRWEVFLVVYLLFQ
jgi:hypothetical protein